VLFGLSAIGLVAVVRTVQKGVKRFMSRDTGVETPKAHAEVIASAESTS
jgi:hypothetical protein